MSVDTIIDYILLFPQQSNVEELKSRCMKIVSTDLKEYLWHKESFALTSSLNYENSGLPVLQGSTNVGENVNDEWFIVYLLTKLSKELPECIIQITDTDENFLLIEAAEHLPSWLRPEISENRVFISQGDLHIIPFPSTPANTDLPTAKPTLQQASKLVLGDEHNTCGSDQIQNCIKKRIEGYPSKIGEDFHHAHCYLPRQLVYMLNNKPELVAVAVDAFYNRDQIDAKICKSLPSFNATKQYTSRVKFTKHLYCQLAQARFIPDHRSPWRLPPTNDTSYKAKELGYKLACGFEILLSRYNTTQKEEKPRGKQWQSYLENLKKNEFFQGEMEGSKKYKELMVKAELHFKESVSRKTTDPFGEILNKLFAESNEDDKEKEIQELCSHLLPDDDDSWMTVTPEELDRMMLGSWNQTNGNTGNENKVENLSKLVDNMKLFVDKVSSYEGVETPTPSVQQTGVLEKGIDDPIEFDAKKFMESISDLLSPPSNYANDGNKDEEDDVTDSDDESVDDDFVTCNDDNIYQGDGPLHDFMGSMDDELRSTSIPRSFQDSAKTEGADTTEEGDLDYDINLVRNFLESFQSQDGLAGPVSNILQSMGMALPPNQDGGAARDEGVNSSGVKAAGS